MWEEHAQSTGAQSLLRQRQERCLCIEEHATWRWHNLHPVCPESPSSMLIWCINFARFEQSQGIVVV